MAIFRKTNTYCSQWWFSYGRAQAELTFKTLRPGRIRLRRVFRIIALLYFYEHNKSRWKTFDTKNTIFWHRVDDASIFERCAWTQTARTVLRQCEMWKCVCRFAHGLLRLIDRATNNLHQLYLRRYYVYLGERRVSNKSRFTTIDTPIIVNTVVSTSMWLWLNCRNTSVFFIIR